MWSNSTRDITLYARPGGLRVTPEKIGQASQLRRLATAGPPLPIDIHIELSADTCLCGLFRGRRWGRALHLKLCILFAHATREVKKDIHVQSARAEGYDTPAQQRKDTTNLSNVAMSAIPRGAALEQGDLFNLKSPCSTCSAALNKGLVQIL